jgi:hypothetical protein
MGNTTEKLVWRFDEEFINQRIIYNARYFWQSPEDVTSISLCACAVNLDKTAECALYFIESYRLHKSLLIRAINRYLRKSNDDVLFTSSVYVNDDVAVITCHRDI